MSFLIDDEKLLGKYKSIWTKGENFKNIELNALPVYNDRYIKIKIRTYGYEVYTNFYSHFCWFLTCLRKQKLSTGIFRWFSL